MQNGEKCRSIPPPKRVLNRLRIGKFTQVATILPTENFSRPPSRQQAVCRSASLYMYLKHSLQKMNLDKQQYSSFYRQKVINYITLKE